VEEEVEGDEEGPDSVIDRLKGLNFRILPYCFVGWSRRTGGVGNPCEGARLRDAMFSEL